MPAQIIRLHLTTHPENILPQPSSSRTSLAVRTSGNAFWLFQGAVLNYSVIHSNGNKFSLVLSNVSDTLVDVVSPV